MSGFLPAFRLSQRLSVECCRYQLVGTCTCNLKSLYECGAAVRSNSERLVFEAEKYRIMTSHYGLSATHFSLIRKQPCNCSLDPRPCVIGILTSRQNPTGSSVRAGMPSTPSRILTFTLQIPEPAVRSDYTIGAAPPERIISLTKSPNTNDLRDLSYRACRFEGATASFAP